MVLKQSLVECEDLHNRINWTVNVICEELGIRVCMKLTHLVLRVKYFQQTFAKPTGSPLSPVLALMENTEQRVMKEFQYPPEFLKRNVDDTLVISKQKHFWIPFSII